MLKPSAHRVIRRAVHVPPFYRRLTRGFLAGVGYFESKMHGMVLQVKEGAGEGCGLETSNKKEGEARQKWKFEDA